MATTTKAAHDVHGEDEDWSGPYTDDSERDDNESEYDEGDSESGGHYSGDDPSIKNNGYKGTRRNGARVCNKIR